MSVYYFTLLLFYITATSGHTFQLKKKSGAPARSMSFCLHIVMRQLGNGEHTAPFRLALLLD